MTTNSALSASIHSLRRPRLLAGVSMLAFAAVAFTGSPAWGEPPLPREKIVFTSTTVGGNVRDNSEIFIMNRDGSQPIRLTNDRFGDGLAVLSPDGKGKIVFDSNRISFFLELPNESDLFLIKYDSTPNRPLQPRPLTRGSSATFDPTGKYIAFHRTAFPTAEKPYGTRIANRPEPGGPTTDSDIFMLNLEDEGEPHGNLTNGLSSTPGVRGDFASDDADWSPDGKWIAFTSRQVFNGVPVPGTLGIYVMNLATKAVTRLTNNPNEER